MEQEYARALAQSLKNGTDETALVAGLVAHLKRDGRTKLLPGIVRELKALQIRSLKLAPSIEVATKEDEKTAEAQAKAYGIEHASVTINPSLIRGWRARTGGMLVDRSAKQALVDLYQKITN